MRNRSGFFERLGIRSQLAAAFLLLLLTMVAMFGWMMGRVSDMLVEKNEEYAREVFALELNNILKKYEQIRYVLESSGYDPDVQQFSQSDDPSDTFLIRQRLDKRFANVKGQNEGILDIVVMGQYSVYSTENGWRSVREAFDEWPQYPSIRVSGITPYQSEYLSLPIPAVIFGCQIPMFSDKTLTIRSTCRIALVYRAQELLIGRERPGLSDDTAFYLVDQNGEICAESILCEGEESAVGRPIAEIAGRQDHFVYDTFIPEIGMRLLGATSKVSLLDDLYAARDRFLRVFFFSASVMIVSFGFMVRRITRPIHSLIGFIHEIGRNDPENTERRVRLDGSREMADVADALNHMLDEISTLSHSLSDTNMRLLKAELEKERMELYSLRSQINPHFLYNTLECIKGLAYAQEPAKIVMVTKAMARVFRYSIKGSETVRLAEEVEIAKAYLSIQAVRFPDKFDVEYHFSACALEVYMPKMILQPMIENAVIHGVEPKIGKSRIVLTGYVEDGTLVLVIEDDGNGIDEISLEGIRRSISEIGAEFGVERSSIGIANISNRIKLLYGAAYGVEIDSQPGRGVRICIRLPASPVDA